VGAGKAGHGPEGSNPDVGPLSRLLNNWAQVTFILWLTLASRCDSLGTVILTYLVLLGAAWPGKSFQPQIEYPTCPERLRYSGQNTERDVTRPEFPGGGEIQVRPLDL
jgi:hypothetical protein